MCSIISVRAYGARLRGPVSSNVRPRKPLVSLLAVSWRNRDSSQFDGAAQKRGPRAGHEVCGSNERGRRSASVWAAEPKAAPERGRCFEKARWRSGRVSSSPESSRQSSVSAKPGQAAPKSPVMREATLLHARPERPCAVRVGATRQCVFSIALWASPSEA